MTNLNQNNTVKQKIENNRLRGEIFRNNNPPPTE